jgi:tetratricopeptide (TPR) repeat protein
MFKQKPDLVILALSISVIISGISIIDGIASGAAWSAENSTASTTAASQGADFYIMKAGLCRFSRHYKRGLDNINKAIELDPKNSSLYETKSFFETKLKEQEDLVQSITAAIELNHGNVELYKKRADAYLLLEKTKEAMDDLNKIIALAPNNPDSYVHMAEAKQELEDFAGATESIQQALKLDAKNALAVDTAKGIAFSWGMDGIAKTKSKQWTAALNSYNKAINLDPNNYKLFLARSEAKFKLNDFKGSVSDMDSAIALEPNKPALYSVRALLKLALPDINGAVEDCDKCEKLGGDADLVKETREAIADSKKPNSK